MTASKSWVFTLQADSDKGEHLAWLVSVDSPISDWTEDERMNYLICQVEKAPTTGQLHLQGFCQFKSIMRLTGLKKINAAAHWEPRYKNSTDKKAAAYCLKEESRVNGPWEYGKLRNEQGKRTDWDDVKQMATDKCSRREIILAHPKLAPCVKGIDVIMEAVQGEPPLERPVRVIFLWGETNQGKSHRVLHKFPSLYKITGKYHEGKSFDGYEGQPCLFLDEWKYCEWPVTLMNDLMDKWRCSLQCRYFNKWAWWEVVVIASNKCPYDAYPAEDQMVRDAWQRRITRTYFIEDRETEVDFE